MKLGVYIIEIDHHHHHGLLIDQTFLTLSNHSSLFVITIDKSFTQHPVSASNWWLCFCWLANTDVSMSWKMSLTSSSLLLQQCLTCLACLTWMVCETGDKWLYSCCFVGCCFQDLFKTPYPCVGSIYKSFIFVNWWCVYVSNLLNQKISLKALWVIYRITKELKFKYNLSHSLYRGFKYYME